MVKHNTSATHESIRGSLSCLLEEGSVAELRVLDTRRGTVSGYYTDFDQMAVAATQMSGKAPGIYTTLNPVNAELLARSANRLKPYAKHTTADGDIVGRLWLPIDVDATRPAGISSTDQEHQIALDKGLEVLEFLVSLGFSRQSLILADSGNGAHVLVRIDLPNDPESAALVQRCLIALDLRFRDDYAHVDLKTYNAARIWKVYGTLACKGDQVRGRRHRQARLLEIPDQIVAAPRERLEQLGAMAPPATRPLDPNGRNRHGRFDVAAWITEHSLPVVSSGDWNGGRKWVLNPCPWNPDHHNSAAYIVQLANGAIAAGCHHDGCTGNDWHRLRDLVEPGWQGKSNRRSGVIPDLEVEL